MASFVDRVVLSVAAGKGGHGCASVHREKFKPLGGPDGGNGGHGGDIVVVVEPDVDTGWLPTSIPRWSKRTRSATIRFCIVMTDLVE